MNYSSDSDRYIRPSLNAPILERISTGQTETSNYDNSFFFFGTGPSLEAQL